uniref:Secreted protein n=1 Tax=Macrostomum lignano TaxID=282301 RepID=A0A1I8F3B8_9PLAT
MFYIVLYVHTFIVDVCQSQSLMSVIRLHLLLSCTGTAAISSIQRCHQLTYRSEPCDLLLILKSQSSNRSTTDLIASIDNHPQLKLIIAPTRTRATYSSTAPIIALRLILNRAVCLDRIFECQSASIAARLFGKVICQSSAVCSLLSRLRVPVSACPAMGLLGSSTIEFGRFAYY